MKPLLEILHAGFLAAIGMNLMIGLVPTKAQDGPQGITQPTKFPLFGRALQRTAQQDAKLRSPGTF